MSDLISKQALIDELNRRRIPFYPQINEIIMSLPTQDRWISCSERLPEETGFFLVCYKGGEIVVAKYGYNTSHEYKCFWVGYVREENIIAWQPLPEPYKPGKLKCRNYRIKEG